MPDDALKRSNRELNAPPLHPRPAVFTPDAWAQLARLTPARVALGRAGTSLPTGALLDFQLAHARARDAVHSPFDPDQLREQIVAWGYPAEVVRSAAGDRSAYLLRPDLGRRLDGTDRERLSAPAARATVDAVVIVADGLSALAVHRQAVPTLAVLLPLLRDSAWRLASIIIAVNGRVAIQDDIGEALHAELALILIGERPGRGAPDSLGAYLVYGPRIGRTDADRNCVSNIRPEGLPPEQAARKLCDLMTQARHHRLSGVGLKDERRLPDGGRSDRPGLA